MLHGVSSYVFDHFLEVFDSPPFMNTFLCYCLKAFDSFPNVFGHLSATFLRLKIWAEMPSRLEPRAKQSN